MVRRLLLVFGRLLILTAGLLGFTTGRIVSHAPRDDIALKAQTEAIIARLTLEEKIGQLFIVDLRSPMDDPILSVTPEVEELFDTYHPGGVLLFGNNIDTVEQTVELTAGLRELSPYPLTIASDYEGGVVSRLTSSGRIPATRIPPSSVIGAAGDPHLAYRIGTIMGRELGVLGITMNLAPVADVLTNPGSMIGNRAFSDDPARVAEMVAAMVRGMQEVGVSSVVKHFPGHGDTTSDTHDGLVELGHGLERLRSVEFVPFSAAVDTGVDGVMTAHITVPQVGGEGVPTTFSKTLITDILRKEMGHDGLILTDSLTMRAIRTRWDSGESAIRAFLAGADIILHPLDLDGAFKGMLRATMDGRVDETRIDESLRRILSTKLKRTPDRCTGADPYEVLGSPEHQTVVRLVLEGAE